MKKKVLFYGVSLLVTLVIIELASYFVGVHLASKGLLYVPQVLPGFEEYMRTRDPILGWPYPSRFGSGRRDETGSRLIPAYPDTRQSCVSLYGDSYTWGSTVGDEEAWGNVLSYLLKCRVANFGAGGYGTDQAYLRFKYNKADNAKLVILGNFSDNISRNVNQFRTLISGDPSFSFKPRFVLDDSGLRLIPIIDVSKTDYVKLVQHPERYLEHEYFVPGGSSLLRHLTFPHTWYVLQSTRHMRFKGLLLQRPWNTELYREDHPAQGLKITARIIRRFHEEAIAREKVPFFFIIGSQHDIKYYRNNQTWAYQTLIDELKAFGIEVINITEGLNEYIGSRNVCDLFNNCAGHLNREGNKVLAELVYEELISRKLVPDGLVQMK